MCGLSSVHLGHFSHYHTRVKAASCLRTQPAFSVPALPDVSATLSGSSSSLLTPSSCFLHRLLCQAPLPNQKQGSRALCPVPTPTDTQFLSTLELYAPLANNWPQHCNSNPEVLIPKPKFTIAHLISASNPCESQAKIPMPGTLISSSVQHMAAFGVLDLLPH